MSLTLKTMSLGTAYAIWSGVGTALTALVGVIAYKKRMDLKKCLGSSSNHWWSYFIKYV